MSPELQALLDAIERDRDAIAADNVTLRAARRLLPDCHEIREAITFGDGRIASLNRVWFMVRDALAPKADG